MIDLGLVHERWITTPASCSEATSAAQARAILAGGRYNALCAKFKRDMPAGGFGIDVESVAWRAFAGASVPRSQPAGIPCVSH